MKEIYQQKKEELFAQFGSENGLTSEQAEKLLKEKGENV